MLDWDSAAIGSVSRAPTEARSHGRLCSIPFDYSRDDALGEDPMDDGVILLVEDNPDDEALTLRALKKNNIRNQVAVARDGVESAETTCWATGAASARRRRAPLLSAAR